MTEPAQTPKGRSLDDLHRPLLDLASEVEDAALRNGVITPLSVTPERLVDGGITFVIWQKVQPQRNQPSEATPPSKPTYSETATNPFLPFDERLRVAEISPTHVCLLNKYNIFDRHLLIVTRQFEHQTNWLTAADFAALWRCMQDVDGLAFYNGGKTAGASQRHKHLQLIPYLPGTSQAQWPVQSVLKEIQWQDGVGRLPQYRFKHAFGSIQTELSTAPNLAGEALLHLYRTLIEAAGIAFGDGKAQTYPYNLLATRDWMLIVPRTAESFQSISVNALGFAGSMLVRNQNEMSLLRSAGPLEALQRVSVACN